jgi:hypothetical protein
VGDLPGRAVLVRRNGLKVERVSWPPNLLPPRPLAPEPRTRHPLRGRPAFWPGLQAAYAAFLSRPMTMASSGAGFCIFSASSTDLPRNRLDRCGLDELMAGEQVG